MGTASAPALVVPAALGHESRQEKTHPKGFGGRP